MKLIVLGTDHTVQEKDYQGSGAFRRILEYIVATNGVQVVMEEWTSTKGATVGHRLAEERGLTWVDVGTSNQPDLETAQPLFDPMETPPIVLNRYGPLPVQIKRERNMVGEICKAMKEHEAGVFVVGMAHLHSMAEKLLGQGFDVEAFNWTTPALEL